jgi:hypothetical protein
MVVEAFPDFDQARVPEDVEMAAQITIGEAAQLPQIREEPPFASRKQRGHDPEPGALVQRAIQALVGKASGF